MSEYAHGMNIAPQVAQTMLSMVFADMETELSRPDKPSNGNTLDWICARAAEERLSVGAWMGQVLKMYQSDLILQEQKAHGTAIHRRRLARIKASRVAVDPAAAVGEIAHVFPDRNRPDHI